MPSVFLDKCDRKSVNRQGCVVPCRSFRSLTFCYNFICFVMEQFHGNCSVLLENNWASCNSRLVCHRTIAAELEILQTLEAVDGFNG